MCTFKVLFINFVQYKMTLRTFRKEAVKLLLLICESNIQTSPTFIFHNIMQIPNGFQQFLEKCGDFIFIILSPLLPTCKSQNLLNYTNLHSEDREKNTYIWVIHLHLPSSCEYLYKKKRKGRKEIKLLISTYTQKSKIPLVLEVIYTFREKRKRCW